MAAYDAYLGGRMVDEELTEERFAEPLTRLPQRQTASALVSGVTVGQAPGTASVQEELP